MLREWKNEYLVSPGNTAVLVIDVQNDYCSPKGAIRKLRNLDTTPVQRAVARIGKFIGLARENRLPIIWTRCIEDYKYIPRNARSKILSSKKKLVLCSPGTWGFEYYKLNPRRGDLEIIKNQYDSFSNGKLNNALRRLRIKNIIATGVYTAVCVDTTVRTAFSLGYNVILPKDLVAMPQGRLDLHNAALKNLGQIFCHISSSREIANIWKLGKNKGRFDGD